MIPQGLETATEELTLVLFTTLAPSGLFALVVLSIYLLFARLNPKQHNNIGIRIIIPNIIALVGLVASATHLGNPANALYVLMRVGKSPLSSEVFAVVLCLLFAGVYWLYAFALKPKLILQKICLAVIAILGVVAISFIAVAYDVRTIITWSTIHVPINLWLNAVIGGSILATLTLQIAKAPGFFIGRSGERSRRAAEQLDATSAVRDLPQVADNIESNTAASSDKNAALASDTVSNAAASSDKVSKFVLGICVLVGVALVANIVSMLLQNSSLANMENALLTATDLVPYYIFVIIAFALLGFAGLLIYVLHYLRGLLPSLPKASLACILVFVGIFLTRFTFYMMHMTAGLAV